MLDHTSTRGGGSEEMMANGFWLLCVIVIAIIAICSSAEKEEAALQGNTNVCCHRLERIMSIGIDTPARQEGKPLLGMNAELDFQLRRLNQGVRMVIHRQQRDKWRQSHILATERRAFYGRVNED